MTDQELHKRIVGIYLKTKWESRFLGSACGCMGRQEGEPVCPCAMRTVVKDEDRFFNVTEELDLEAQVVSFRTTEIFVPKKIRYYLVTKPDTLLLTYRKILQAISYNYGQMEPISKLLEFKRKLDAGNFELDDYQPLRLRTAYPELYEEFVVEKSE